MLSYYIYFQIVSFIFSIIFYRGLKAFKLLGFIPLLFVVCVTEITAINSQALGFPNNHFIYNYYVLISTPITLYIFMQMLAYKGLTKVIYVSLASLLCIFILLNFFFLQGSTDFDTYSLIIVEFVIAIVALLTIARLFQQDESPILLNKHPYFWIGASTLIFSAVTLIILGLQQFIELKNIQINGKIIYQVIMPMVNVLLYSSYSYAFYLCKKLTNKYLRP